MVLIAGIHLTEHKPKLKMGSFISVNVSVKKNTFCMDMAKTDTICKHCYARYMENRYPRLAKTLYENYNNLSLKLLTADQIESIGNYIIAHAHGLRFNSIGELINDHHAVNINLIAMYIRAQKPKFPITIWSKRPGLIRKFFEPGKNMNIIYSNPIINSVQRHVPEGFNGIFNVVTYDYAIGHDPDMGMYKTAFPNCAGKCRDCMKCYKPAKDNTFVIIELLKRDQNKIKKGILEAL